MATPSQRFFSPSQTLSGSGLPVARPITTYTATPLPGSLTTARTTYPTNSNLDSRESLEDRKPDLGAYRYIESAGAVTYRAVSLGLPQHRQTQREPLPDVPMVMGANGLHVPYEPRKEHPSYTTTNGVLGAERPARFVTDEYRWHPRAHTWTKQFSGGNYRSFGLSTAKDEVRTHRVEFFSTP